MTVMTILKKVMLKVRSGRLGRNALKTPHTTCRTTARACFNFVYITQIIPLLFLPVIAVLLLRLGTLPSPRDSAAKSVKTLNVTPSSAC